MNSYIIKSIDGPDLNKNKDNAFNSNNPNSKKNVDKIQALGYSQSRENVTSNTNANVVPDEDVILYKVNVKIDQYKSGKIVVHKGDSL